MAMADAFSVLRRYTNIFGDAYGTDEFSLFLYSLVRMECPLNLLELGTGYGVSALWIALALDESGEGHLCSIDDGRQYAEAIMDRAMMRNALSELSEHGAILEGEFGYHDYLRQIAEYLGVSDRVSFVSATLDDKNLLNTLRSCTAVLDKPLDLVFSDYASSARGLYYLLGGLLPYMGERASIFLDSVSTQFETYLALERLVGQLNERSLPLTVARHHSPDHCFRLRRMLESHELRLSHIVDRKHREQNSRAWIRIEPIDLIPFPDDLVSW